MKHADKPSLADMVRSMAVQTGQAENHPDLSPQRENMDKLMDMLVVLFVTSNIAQQKRPLKAFMNDLEKRLIESSLSLTQGNQRHAAAILGVKPTALFEKIKKHGMRGDGHRPPSPPAPPLPVQLAGIGAAGLLGGGHVAIRSTIGG